jgi:hypothetical protein
MVARSRVSKAADFDFAVLLYDLGRLRLQDRIGVIANIVVGIADAITPRPIRDRAGTRW